MKNSYILIRTIEKMSEKLNPYNNPYFKDKEAWTNFFQTASKTKNGDVLFIEFLKLPPPVHSNLRTLAQELFKQLDSEISLRFFKLAMQMSPESYSPIQIAFLEQFAKTVAENNSFEYLWQDYETKKAVRMKIEAMLSEAIANEKEADKKLRNKAHLPSVTILNYKRF